MINCLLGFAPEPDDSSTERHWSGINSYFWFLDCTDLIVGLRGILKDFAETKMICFSVTV